MLRVRIRDFQSIRDGTFDIDRFTVITGTNNLGKSALFRAVKGVFTNPTASFVREGQKFSIVDISDGTRSVSWKKGPKVSAVYTLTVEGKTTVLDNVGHNCPPEVLKAFGIGTLQAGNATLWPQFADQFTGPLFLLDKPGSAIADAVANVKHIRTLNRSLKACESDRRSVAKTLEVRRRDQEGIETRLARFEGLDVVVEHVEVLEATRKRAERVANGHQKLERLRRQYDSAWKAVAALAATKGLSIPEDEVSSIAQELREARSLRGRLTEAQEGLRRLQGFAASLPEQGLLERLRKAQEGIKEVRSLKLQLLEARQQAEVLQGVVGVAQEVGVAPEVKKRAEQMCQVLSLLRALRTEMITSQRQVEECDTELEAVQTEFNALNTELAEALGRYDECPLCGVALKHEH